MSETRTIIDGDALELARLLESTWPERSARLRASGVPLNEGTPGAPAAATAEPGGEPAGGGGGGESGAGGESQGVDYDRIEEMLSGRFAEMEQRLPAAPTPEPEPEADPYSMLDEMYDDPAQAAGARNVLQELIGGAVQQSLAPIQQENQQLRAQLMQLTNDLDAGDLEERFPALAQQETAQTATQQALQFAQRLGMQIADPRQIPVPLIEMAYLAGLGRERIAAETPAGGANPGLEAAGGATPASEEPDIATNIVNARGQRTPGMSFWGA